MAAASYLRNGAFLLVRHSMARAARRMCMSRTGSGAANTGGGGGGGGPGAGLRTPAEAAANSGGARVNGSGSAATGGSGGATGGGGGAATNSASNSSGRGTAGGAVANSGGGGAANSGSGGGSTGVELLRKDIFKETRRLWDGYNWRSEVDMKLFDEIARLEMDSAMNRVKAKVNRVSTTYKFLGSAAAFIIAGVTCVGPYVKHTLVHDAAKEVDERMSRRELEAEEADKAATPGEAAPTMKVRIKPTAAAPTGGSASSVAAAPGAPAPVDVKKRAAPAPVDAKKGAAAPAAGSASVDK